MTTSYLDAAMTKILALTEGPVTLEKIRQAIELSRNKPMLVEEDDMPAGMTGYAVGLRDVDLLCTRRGLEGPRKELSYCHELMHFLRGDIPPLQHGAETPTYAEFIQRRDFDLVVCRKALLLDSVTEQQTELTAKFVLKYLDEQPVQLEDQNIRTFYRI